MSGLLGFWQEKRAADAVEKLLSIVQINARVLRDGAGEEIHVEEVVPGDIVILDAGDVIPGDCLLLESKDLFVDEAALTGESFPAEKNAGELDADTPLARRANALWMGTRVISGAATAVVVRTGAETEFGQVSERLRLKPAETEFEHGVRKLCSVWPEPRSFCPSCRCCRSRFCSTTSSPTFRRWRLRPTA